MLDVNYVADNLEIVTKKLRERGTTTKLKKEVLGDLPEQRSADDDAADDPD